MDKETIKLKKTIASRLTTIESNNFSMFVKENNTTRSEFIRILIINFLQKQKQTNKQILTTKKQTK